MVTKRFVVSGRVQGVGFRYFVVREAEALALAGWVRNLADGRVEVLVAGDAAAVDVMGGRLWEGPPRAHVSGVETFAAEAPATAGFRVLPTPW